MSRLWRQGQRRGGRRFAKHCRARRGRAGLAADPQGIGAPHSQWRVGPWNAHSARIDAHEAAFAPPRMTVSKAIQSAGEGRLRRAQTQNRHRGGRSVPRSVPSSRSGGCRRSRGSSRRNLLLQAAGVHEAQAGSGEARAVGCPPVRTPTLWMLCLHLSDGKPFQLEERLINIDAAPGITCRPLESVGPGLWLLGNVPWTDAEHKIINLRGSGGYCQTLGHKSRSHRLPGG